MFGYWLNSESLPASFKNVATGQLVNVTFHYHILNSGFGDFKIFNPSMLVKLAIANDDLVFHPLGCYERSVASLKGGGGLPAPGVTILG